MHTNLSENANEIDSSPHQECNKCHEMKPHSAFAKHKKSKNGLKATCKPCLNQENKIYYQNNRARIREKQDLFYRQNKDRILQYHARHYQKNKFRIDQRNKLWHQKNGKKNYQKNKSKILSRDKEYRKKNKDLIRKRQTLYRQKNGARIYQYVKNKVRIDVNFKLSLLLRKRIQQALKSKSIVKQNRSNELLGCKIEQYKSHLESTFQQNMSWQNHGEWHIDHIKPIASFDLTDAEQQKLAFNFKNTQALWKADNLSKGAKIDWIKPTTYATV